MNKTLKQALAFGLAVVGVGLWGSRAEAAPNPDTIVVSVTPGNPTYGVVITSPQAGGYSFGSVNLGLTTISTEAIVVQSSGTVSEYFAMSVVSDGGADAWAALGADGTPGHNEFELLGRFNSTQPADSDFSGANDIVTGSIPGVGAGKYNQGGRTTPGNTQNLWLKLKMPSSVSSSSTRNLTLAVNGQAN